MNAGSLQTQIDTLRQQVAGLQQALEQTRQALEQSRRENTILRQKLDALARRFFGKKSEQLDAAQLELLLRGLTDGSEEAVAAEDEPPAMAPSRTPRANPAARAHAGEPGSGP